MNSNMLLKRKSFTKDLKIYVKIKVESFEPSTYFSEIQCSRCIQNTFRKRFSFYKSL